MITEDYVNFEIATLLKEKGFNEKCRAFYTNSVDIGVEFFTSDNYIDYSSVYPITICPTLQMTMKWLREVHKILILIDWELSKKEYIAYMWEIDKEHQQGLHKLRKDGKYLFQYASYEKACEEIILFILKNII
jgi:hypothetical protein